jgi:hypothetical protein
LAETSFRACGVTLVSVRAKRSTAMTFMPFFSASGVRALSHSSPYASV